MGLVFLGRGLATRRTARFTLARNWVTVCSGARSNTRASTTAAVSGVNDRVASTSSVACRCVISPDRSRSRVCGRRLTRSEAMAICPRIRPGGTRTAAATMSRVNPSFDCIRASNAASSSVSRACNQAMWRCTATRASICPSTSSMTGVSTSSTGSSSTDGTDWARHAAVSFGYTSASIRFGGAPTWEESANAGVRRHRITEDVGPGTVPTDAGGERVVADQGVTNAVRGAGHTSWYHKYVR